MHCATCLTKYARMERTVVLLNRRLYVTRRPLMVRRILAAIERLEHRRARMDNVTR